MNINRLKVDQVVYSVSRQTMGNTTMQTTVVHPVRIIEINVKEGWVLASWNCNRARKFYSKSISAWREKKPVLVYGVFGRARLATAAELKELKTKSVALPVKEKDVAPEVRS